MADQEATPDVPGHAEPDTGMGEGAESEIPVGVDGLTDEQIAKADEAGPVAGSGDDDDDGALDVAALMEEGGADATPDDDVAEPDNAGEGT